jgi:glutamate synthase (ferredoxin)
MVDLGGFYTDDEVDEAGRTSWVSAARKAVAHSNGPCLDDDLLADEEIQQLLEQNTGVLERHLPISNTDRSVAGRLAGAIARKHGDNGFNGELKLTFMGAAGQSFGVWNIQGVHLTVLGECNDYVGKGMSGGTIAVTPPPSSTFEASENVIAGNTCLYGATGGNVFLNGTVGERFGVRNAGCRAVIEGAGDHLGEYMTNGIVVALGRVGRNVGAGMSGGLLYLYDPEGEGVKMNENNAENLFRVVTDAGEAQLRDLIESHAEATASPHAKAILAEWPAALGKFWQVAPPSEQASGMVAESARIQREPQGLEDEPKKEALFQTEAARSSVIATAAGGARSRSASPTDGGTEGRPWGASSPAGGLGASGQK